MVQVTLFVISVCVCSYSNVLNLFHSLQLRTRLGNRQRPWSKDSVQITTSG